MRNALAFNCQMMMLPLQPEQGLELGGPNFTCREVVGMKHLPFNCN